MPDEVLEEFVGVLVLDNEICGLDDLANILNELESLGREFVFRGRLGAGLRETRE